ncbi:MAG: hypothetical protein ACI9UN_002469, partial [Granulosicoccus sp.]
VTSIVPIGQSHSGYRLSIGNIESDFLPLCKIAMLSVELSARKDSKLCELSGPRIRVSGQSE